MRRLLLLAIGLLPLVLFGFANDALPDRRMASMGRGEDRSPRPYMGPMNFRPLIPT